MSGPGLNLVGQEEIEEVLEVLNSGYLYRYGPDTDPAFKAKVRTLEQRVAERMGIRYAVAVNSGTSALTVILAGLGVGAGDEVIVPGFTFIASISAIVYAGALPVLAEIDDTFNLDPADVEARITPRTRAIMAVHMLGNPARLKELSEVARRRDVALIEDCAQAFGASYGGKSVGGFGVAGGLSFNAYKTITAGDGGMVVTNDEALYRRCFAMHDQGHSPLRNGVEMGRRPFLGLDFRMTELSAAVLLAQLRKVDTILERLRANKALLKSMIADLPGLAFRTLPDPSGDLATHLVVMFPSEHVARSVTRELGSRVLAESGWHIYSQMEHLLSERTASMKGPPFRDGANTGGGDRYWPGMLPQTDALVRRAMSIGIGVSDPNLGSNFGVTVRDGEPLVRERAHQFRAVASRYLHA
jgi:dTDP-4-amino-4,6-dideoxygalactose transaminase